MKKLSNTEAELKKTLFIIKSVYCNRKTKGRDDSTEKDYRGFKKLGMETSTWNFKSYLGQIYQRNFKSYLKSVLMKRSTFKTLRHLGTYDTWASERCF